HEEPRIEGRIVRHEGTAAEQLRYFPRDVAEGRRREDICGVDAVDVLRAEVTLRIDERAPRVFALTVRTEQDDPDLDDAVVPGRAQSSGLEVDDGVTSHSIAPEGSKGYGVMVADNCRASGWNRRSMRT